jgi:hypothetical protein
VSIIFAQNHGSGKSTKLIQKSGIGINIVTEIQSIKEESYSTERKKKYISYNVNTKL